jgi:hypothetical protein
MRQRERALLDARIEELAVSYQDLLRRLATIPGVDRTTALVLWPSSAKT